MARVSSSKTCILEVEDDEDEIFHLQYAFKQSGITHPVQVATDGQQAIDYLAGAAPFADRNKHPLPWLVLLNLDLRRKTGLEVLEWIRAQPSFRMIVTIVFAASYHIADAERANQLCANFFLVKPLDVQERMEIARLLRSSWLVYNQFAPIGKGNRDTSLSHV